MTRHTDVLVVGAGFAGAVMAERFAHAGFSVLVVDRREHLGGNAYDYEDEGGVRVHRYGPHLFHTNSAKVFDYLSRFTEWWPYEHRVLAHIGDRLVPVPINRTTLNLLYDAGLSTDEQAAAFLDARAESFAGGIRNSEQAVVSKVGRELYEKFYRGYTSKQWGRDPRELAASVCARIPIRHNTDDRYFGDTYQAMPADGYTAMFTRMLDHPRIETRVGTDFEAIRGQVQWQHLVWTGPVDEYFEHRYGRLPYRSLHFERVVHRIPDGDLTQPVATVNYPDPDVPYTRITEFGHLDPVRHNVSVCLVEYPRSDGDPYYPVPAPESQQLYMRYERLAHQTKNTTFVGRLASYRYYNMDQVVAQALATFDLEIDDIRARIRPGAG